MNHIILVIETNVLGVLGYHAQCKSCGWRSRPYEQEQAAANAAKRHGPAADGQRWRSAYVMTAGVTCGLCFNAGKRGPDAMLFAPDEIRSTSIHAWGTARFNAERRRRMLKHLREQHPDALHLYFPKGR